MSHYIYIMNKTEEDKLNHKRELNKKRAKKYYDTKKQIISERRKIIRDTKKEKNKMIIFNNFTREQTKKLLFDRIKVKYNKLKDNSINTYASSLNYILYTLLKISDTFYFEIFDAQDKIIQLLKEDTSKNEAQRKVYWKALIKITDKNDKYTIEFEKDIIVEKEIRNKQEKTEKQTKNWVSKKEMDVLYKQYTDNYYKLFNKEDISKTEYQKLQELVIVSIYTQLEGAPRLMEFTEMKIKNYDISTDNYYKDGYFYYNKFKTIKSESSQNEMLNSNVKSIIDKFILYNPTDYLLIDNNCNKLNNIQLNQRINKIFNKKVGVNGLRHSKITELYNDNSIILTEISKNAKKNKHSILTHLQYIKN